MFARGDRKLSKVLLAAHKNGCKFDGWNEYFNFEMWMKAFDDCGVDPKFYNQRKRGFDEIRRGTTSTWALGRSFWRKRRALPMRSS